MKDIMKFQTHPQRMHTQSICVCKCAWLLASNIIPAFVCLLMCNLHLPSALWRQGDKNLIRLGKCSSCYSWND